MSARALRLVFVTSAAGVAAWWFASRRAAPAAGTSAGATQPEPESATWASPLPALDEVIESMETAVTNLTLPRGLRNNNPGNLRPTSDVWQGEARPRDDGGGYLRFISAHYGLRAAAVNLKNQQLKHGLRTVRKIITKYAPPSENKTEAYIAAVAKRLGVAADATIDMTSPATLERFLRAVVTHENGRGDYYDDGTYARAVQAAL